MIRIRRSHERGHADHGWLDTRFSFSFADYYDPEHMGFRSLRVLNEDRVAPGQGFGMHPHRDMEILTYVLDGELEHRDSLGNGEVMKAGELQRMTAGTGILHSEFNPSPARPVHLFQVWVLPERRGLTPGYEQRRFDPAGRAGTWQLVAARDGRGGSLTIHQDAEVYLADVSGKPLAHPLRPGRHAWVQVLRGNVTINGSALVAGDAVAVSDEAAVTVRPDGPAEVMLFDLA